MHMQTARTESARSLRQMLETEALAAKHPAGWVDQEMARLTHA